MADGGLRFPSRFLEKRREPPSAIAPRLLANRDARPNPVTSFPLLPSASASASAPRASASASGERGVRGARGEGEGGYRVEVSEGSVHRGLCLVIRS